MIYLRQLNIEKKLKMISSIYPEKGTKKIRLVINFPTVVGMLYLAKYEYSAHNFG